MTHKFTQPTDIGLEKLITRAFESMPEAEQSRLSLIESRILRETEKNKQKKLNKIPWWIVLLLAGGFATAAWWAGDLIISEQNKKITEKQNTGSGNIDSRQVEVEKNEPETNDEKTNENYQDNDSPVIYQRESF